MAGNQRVLEQSDTIILALRPDHAAKALGRLAFRADHRVISLMAGLDHKTVSRMIIPARFEAVMLAFPNIAKQGSPILVHGQTGLIKALFGARNSIFKVENTAGFDAYLCAQAVLSPAVLLVQGAAKWLGARIEDQKQGEQFLRALVGSNLSSGQCAPLLEALNTTGGYNQRLREHMVRQGISAALTEGLDGLETGRSSQPPLLTPDGFAR